MKNTTYTVAAESNSPVIGEAVQVKQYSSQSFSPLGRDDQRRLSVKGLVGMLGVLLCVTLVASPLAAIPPPPVSPPPTVPVVRFVYLIPSDKALKPKYRNAIGLAAKHLQIWYRNQLANGKTFQLQGLVVETRSTSHPAAWYSTHNSGSDYKYWFWDNVLADGFGLTGGKFNDPHYRWIYYTDADPGCNNNVEQVGGAGTQGVAELPANDLRGLTGESNVPRCVGKTPDNAPPCRWVGGLGHELGHSFGLPHPPGCDDPNDSVPCSDPDSLLWTGYAMYSDTYLRQEDQDVLNQSPFFRHLDLPTSLFNCDTIPQAASIDISGDVNGDGAVNEADLAKLDSAIAGISSLNTVEFNRADVAQKCGDRSVQELKKDRQAIAKFIQQARKIGNRVKPIKDQCHNVLIGQALPSSQVSSSGLSKLDVQPESGMVLDAGLSGVGLQVEIFGLNGTKICDLSGDGNSLSAQFAEMSRALANGVYLARVTVRATDGSILRTEVQKIGIVR